MNRSSLAIIFIGWSSNEYSDPNHGFHYLLAIDLCYLPGSCVSLTPHCMRLRACCCSGSKLSSDRTPLPNLDRTISSSFLLMALPFIVGPRQCSLTQGPEGRPQVEMVLRIRLPLAEFFDALLLSLAEQHPLFQQVGHEPAPTPTAPVKAGLQTTGHRSPPLTEEASPKRKTTGRTQPKRAAHPPKHDTPVDPTHEKLLAVLSHAARLPDTGEGGAAMAAADFPPASRGCRQLRNRPPAGLPDRQLAVDFLHSSITHGHIQYRVAEDGTHEHLPPPRAFAHPKKCPVQ